ncbi:MAG TPA: PhzF family phenazine biosynthesis protein [Kofleriaceae bacterium]|nr:PhzF family phenazine biosynthesis protein [Kofleriaceae bacterium]
MRLPYRIVNVFTAAGDPLSGNPLCVFEDGQSLDDAHMQALARQLNLSETTFVLPSETATARVRIFTPSYEMPFAGHPTLGTAHVVGQMRGLAALTFEMTAGIVPVTAEAGRWTLRAAKTPTATPPNATRDQLAAMLGLPADAIAGDPLWVDTGSRQLVIPLSSAEHVRAAKPNPELLYKHAKRDDRESMAYVVAREGEHLLVRFFFTQRGSVVEDPATGSACANLGGYYVVTGRALPLAETLHQGELIDRPSHLGLRVDQDRKIFVTGEVIDLGGGAFEL